MNQLYAVALTGLLLAGSATAFADEDVTRGQLMRSMDTDNDGMISRAEFYRANERMWADMKKNDKGLVDVQAATARHAVMGQMRADETVRLDCRMRQSD
jgi:hypothetical protein